MACCSPFGICRPVCFTACSSSGFQMLDHCTNLLVVFTCFGLLGWGFHKRSMAEKNCSVCRKLKLCKEGMNQQRHASYPQNLTVPCLQMLRGNCWTRNFAKFQSGFILRLKIVWEILGKFCEISKRIYFAQWPENCVGNFRQIRNTKYPAPPPPRKAKGGGMRPTKLDHFELLGISG